MIKQKEYSMDYIYIDESGDLGSDSDYLIMAAIIVDDSAKLDRIINKIRKVRQEFNSLFVPSLNNPKNHSITIEHEDSVNIKGLQMADVLLWSVYHSIEHENKDYVDLIKV